MAEGLAKGKAEGRTEGRVDGKKEVAINLLAMNMPIEAIAQATGLSEESILALKAKTGEKK